MKRICDDCHFRQYENGEPKQWLYGDGTLKPVGCINIGCDGWANWAEKHEPPEACEEYVKEGEYKPSGVWAGLTAVLEAVHEQIGGNLNE